MGKGFECEFEYVPQYLAGVTIYGGKEIKNGVVEYWN